MREENTVTVREKQPQDDEAAAFLVAEAFRDKYSVFANNDWNRAVVIAQDEMKWRGKCGNFFVAETGGEIAGAIEIIGTDISGVPYAEHMSIYLKRLGLLNGLRASFLYSLLSRVVADNEACVSSLAVAGNARGRGIARALLARGDEYALETGKKFIVLWVAEDNVRARGVYDAAGYKEAERSASQQLKKHFGHENWILMRKEIV